MESAALRRGGRVLADSLIDQGIDHVFSVPGESFLDVLDGLHHTEEQIKLVTCRFEGGAVHMAEAYGKLNGRPAAAMVTRGPGACHAAIGVHVAFQDSTPLILFVGQIPFEYTDRECFQEVDYRRLFGPIAKWVTQIDDARRIPEVVAHAVDVATSGRPGPVVIALSEEMQREMVAASRRKRLYARVGRPDKETLERLQEMLAKAERPVAILGGGAWSEEGRKAIQAFLTANNLPVAVGFRRQQLYDGTLDNYIGDLGIGSDPSLVASMRKADLVLAIGSRLNDVVTQQYELFDMENGRTPIIHIYPDQAEIGRVFRPTLGIASDLNAFALAAAELPAIGGRWDEWTRQLRALRLQGQEAPQSTGDLNVAQVMRELETVLTDDAILTTDAGNFSTWPARFINFKDGQRYIGPINGAMGYAVPAAVGASIAYPDRMVVAFVGDGGYLMTGQEVATAFHHGTAPIIIVFNNGMYGTIRMHQEREYPGRVSGTHLTNPDFARLIEAFGGHGETVSKTADFLPAFERARASGKPSIIELQQDPEQITSRTTITALRNR